MRQVRRGEGQTRKRAGFGAQPTFTERRLNDRYANSHRTAGELTGPASGDTLFRDAATRIADREAQARHIELAVRRVAEIADIRDDHRRNEAQPLDDFSRFVKPSQVGIRGGKEAVGQGKTRILLDGED